MRDYKTAALLSQCADDVLVDAHEVHVLTAIAKATVEQRRVPGMPAPIKGLRLLRWRLGDLRAWMNAGKQPGRPAAAQAQDQSRVHTHRTQSSDVPKTHVNAGVRANTPPGGGSSQS